MNGFDGSFVRKEFPDLDFEGKNRILKLYDKAQIADHVVYYDDFGPMELRPSPSLCLAHKQHPPRLRVT